ncbi:MAG: ParB/RepB/Spo0J family partition protein [Lachnospiraceae bacterium]|nr:ParB/RepB/Spo0J family partition protein [Lachnospiraceae bacterium]
MAKKSGLGRGLDALIVNKEDKSDKSTRGEVTLSGEPIQVDINKVEPNRSQPRKNFNEDALNELAESIKIHGVITPIIVVERDDYYMIVAGERRWRASKLAEQKTVPVVVRNDLTDQEILEISLIENTQREDLNPIEEANTYQRLIDEFNMKQDEVAERVSKSRPAIANALRLLKLDARVQKMLIDEIITAGHARTLLAITDGDKQHEFAQRILDEKMSVHEVEKEIKKMQAGPDQKETKPKIDPKLEIMYRDLEEKLKQKLGTKVTINAKDNQKGKLEIEYYNQDELEKLIDILHDGY